MAVQIRKDDLFVHLMLCGGALLDASDLKNVRSGIVDIQADLFEHCGFSLSGASSAAFTCKEVAGLLQKINLHLSKALQLAIESIDLALKLDFPMEFEQTDENGLMEKYPSSFSSQPIFFYAMPDIRIWILAQSYDGNIQFQLAEAREAWAIWREAQSSLEACEEYADADTLKALQKEARESLEFFKESVAMLPPEAQSILTSDQVGNLEFSAHAAPTMLMPGMSSSNIRDIHRRCVEIARYMLILDEVSTSMAPADRKKCIGALESFHFAAMRLKWLGRWIDAYANAISTTTQVRRCAVCYKHLGQGDRLYCVSHRRTQSDRQPSATPYLRNAYQRNLGRFFMSERAMASAFSGKAMTGGMLNMELERSWAAGWVHADLVHNVAVLAYHLRKLYVVVAPVYQNKISSHFVQMIEAANEAFDLRKPTNTQLEMRMVRIQQDKAIAWVTVNNFFKTLYGRSQSEDKGSEEYQPKPALWQEVDPNHPMLQGSTMKTIDHAQHLARIRCWEEADIELNTTGYMDSQMARRLRAKKLPNGGVMSYAAIANHMRSSKNAVAAALGNANSLPKKPSRKRVLKKYMTEILGDAAKKSQ